MGSIHHQSYTNIEHIVIDNNSTDNTKILLNEYSRNGWITTLAFEPERGIYTTMNKGITLAKGNYINIMNTDDYFIDLNYLEKAVTKINETNTDFVHADRLIKSKSGKPDTVKRGNERQAFFRMPFRHQTMVVKREIFDEIGLFDEKYQVCADYKWVLQMLIASKKGLYIPQTVLSSLDGGASSNREKCVEEVSQILFECYGKEYNLTLEDCKNIYLRNFSTKLISKIIFKIKNRKIRNSLIYGFLNEQI